MARPQASALPPKRRRPPAKTPEGRERQMIDLAVEVAEEQLMNRTASSQVITHYLKLATTREQLEQLKLKKEVALLAAKEENLASQGRIEELYKGAIAAIRKYQGQEVDDDDR